MDMTTTSAAMAMATNATNNPTSSSTASASGISMSGMSMGGSSECKLSMLWNWYTIDACFLSSTWHVTSKGMFAGSCIGVIALVLLLEFLRRLQREYDRFIQPRSDSMSNNNNTKTAPATHGPCSKSDGIPDNSSSLDSAGDRPHSAIPLLGNSDWRQSAPLGRTRHVPSLSQQAVRAGIHTMQFTVAYIIMLLAMYYNGYILICIFIGVFLGFFAFSWDPSGGGSTTSSENAACCA